MNEEEIKRIVGSILNLNDMRGFTDDEWKLYGDMLAKDPVIMEDVF